MIKKIIIIILIILIIASVGVIGYIILSQNPSFNFANLWPFKSTLVTTAPKIPANFFPTSTTTVNVGQPNRPGVTNTGTNSVSQQVIVENPNLAGASALGLSLRNNGNLEQVFFVDRQNGNVYEITAKNDLARVTGETLNNISEVYWGRDKTGDHLITRLTQFNQIITLSGLIKYASSTNLGKLGNQILGTNISALTVSPDGSKLFTLEPTKDGVTGYVVGLDGKNKKKIWSFPFGNWQVSWPKDNIIALTTIPSANDYGFLYFLNPTTGSLVKILRGVNGLTASISPSGQKMIYSRGNQGGLTLYLYDLNTQKTSLFGLNTLPEKCTWVNGDLLYCAVPRTIPRGLYPDNWYKGKTAFADDIWKIDLKQGVTVLAVPIKGNLDLENLVVATRRGWIYAINKTDSSIQSFVLPQ